MIGTVAQHPYCWILDTDKISRCSHAAGVEVKIMGDHGPLGV